MAELADALDLGSSVPDVQVQVLLPAVNERAKSVEKSTFLALFYLKILNGEQIGSKLYNYT